jgi:hypothetical protein
VKRSLAACAALGLIVASALGAGDASACMNPDTAGKIPVVQIDPAYDAGAWRRVHLGNECTLDWGGILTVATNGAVYVEVMASEAARIHAVYTNPSRRSHRWIGAIPSGQVTRVGVAPALVVEQAVLPGPPAQGSVPMRIVRIPRLPGFDVVGLELSNGVQSWATRCSSQGAVGVGRFVDGGRCRIAGARPVLTR